MKLRNLPLLLLLTVMLGCSDGVVGPLRTEEYSASKTETMVPITWDYLMQSVVPADPGPDDFVVCEIPSPPAPEPISLPLPKYWKAQGLMSHLGRLNESLSTAAFTNCAFDLYDGQPALVGGLIATMVGANGDAVELTGTLTLTFGVGPDGLFPIEAYGDFDIVGGTGRFGGASGWIKTVEEETPMGAKGTGHGMITPPGRLHG